MRDKVEFTRKDEQFILKIDSTDVNLFCKCTTQKGSIYEHIVDYEAVNEFDAVEMFRLLKKGNIFIDGGKVTCQAKSKSK